MSFRVGPEGFDLSGEPVPAADLGRVHFLGIGGIGMSAIARVMLDRGIPVSGSDAKDLPVLHDLAARGARVGVGFDPARLDDVDTVVASSAVRADNPELSTARARGLRVLHRSQSLAAVMVGKRGVCVAGTNGKTTTTSMLTELLAAVGADPSFAVGGELVGAGTNGADGSGEVFVAEADESDASFLVYRPQVSVVTNVQPDHLDHYGTGEAVAQAFTAFAERLGHTGTLVVCTDDPGAAALARARHAAGARVLGYGREPLPVPGFAISAPEATPDGTEFTLTAVGGAHDLLAQPVRLHCPAPGSHNVLNATAAFAAALALGIAADDAARGLAGFTGARRRFERKGEAGGVLLYDDYAHNPPKVTAAVATAAQVAAAREGRLIAVFQPHLYSRTRDFAAEFGAALSGADAVLVTDVYAAREEPLPGVSGALVADAVTGAARVEYVPALADVPSAVLALARPGDVVVTIGAGDVTALGPQVLAALEARR